MILAIDQGTTGTTCLVFDEAGRPGGRAYSEFGQHFPRPGWVEHDPAEIWDVTVKVAGQALEDAGAKGEDLDGIGFTNQRETAVAWDRESGEPLRRETTALGAAYLAGIAAGTWTQEHVRGVWTEDRRFEPDLADDRRQELLADCRRALERSRRWVLADA